MKPQRHGIFEDVEGPGDQLHSAARASLRLLAGVDPATVALAGLEGCPHFNDVVYGDRPELDLDSVGKRLVRVPGLRGGMNAHREAVLAG